VAWVPVARLGRTRGRSGELTGEIYSSHPGRDEELMESRRVALDKPDRRLEIDIERIWRHDGRPVFKFLGLDSISAAEEWEGADVLVPMDQGVQKEAGEYTHADLIGCRVEAGSEVVGIVRGVEEFGSAPLLKVEAADGREILIPFARSICKEIDVAGKVIRADVPEGLLEL
jgi:16S rRNA processing protein RimM